MTAEERQFQQTVAAALRDHDPPIQVTGLGVVAMRDGPRILGPVATDTDRDWVPGLARNALGREVHDGLEVDRPGAAPATEHSPHQAEGDAATPPRDRTQTDTDPRRAGIYTRRPPAGGEGHVEELRPDDQRTSPDRPRRPQESAAPEERPRPF